MNEVVKPSTYDARNPGYGGNYNNPNLKESNVIELSKYELAA
jgi:hypothetical protein